MKPFNTHEKRLFVQMYVAAYMGWGGFVTGERIVDGRGLAELAWQNALEAGLIQDHDADQQEQSE